MLKNGMRPVHPGEVRVELLPLADIQGFRYHAEKRGQNVIRMLKVTPRSASHYLDARYRRMRGLICLLILSISAFGHAADSISLEGRKIDFLIASIETLQDAQFIRNGTAYSAKAAADHLRLKLRMAGSRVSTADDFIRLCASASSVSGTPYQIRFTDGRAVTSETYLRHKLAEFKP